MKRSAARKGPSCVGDRIGRWLVVEVKQPTHSERITDAVYLLKCDCGVFETRRDAHVWAGGVPHSTQCSRCAHEARKRAGWGRGNPRESVAHYLDVRRRT